MNDEAKFKEECLRALTRIIEVTVQLLDQAVRDSKTPLDSMSLVDDMAELNEIHSGLMTLYKRVLAGTTDTEMLDPADFLREEGDPSDI